jgi:hypothetical protein
MLTSHVGYDEVTAQVLVVGNGAGSQPGRGSSVFEVAFGEFDEVSIDHGSAEQGGRDALPLFGCARIVSTIRHLGSSFIPSIIS